MEQTGRVFHIDTSRFERIRSQGWKQTVLPTKLPTLDPAFNVYHLIDSNQAECPVCHITVKGLVAETPAELEAAKAVALRG